MKNYWAAILLALFFGSIGLQEFYLGRLTRGILSILFCWTCIPAIVAFVEAIIWLFDGEAQFDKEFNSKKQKPLYD